MPIWMAIVFVVTAWVVVRISQIQKTVRDNKERLDNILSILQENAGNPEGENEKNV